MCLSCGSIGNCVSAFRVLFSFFEPPAVRSLSPNSNVACLLLQYCRKFCIYVANVAYYQVDVQSREYDLFSACKRIKIKKSIGLFINPVSLRLGVTSDIQRILTQFCLILSYTKFTDQSFASYGGQLVRATGKLFRYILLGLRVWYNE